jgi:hypothetical protein
METTQFEIAYKKASIRWLNYPLHIANMQIFKIKKPELLALTTLRFARSLGVNLPTRYTTLGFRGLSNSELRNIPCVN